MKYFLPLLLLLGCSKMTQVLDSRYDESFDKNYNSDTLGLVFSNNINGETHPCGCRQHPLGGLAQVAGAMYSFKQKLPIIYVDSGDTFFPSPKHPEDVKKIIRVYSNEDC
jgi:hypothetical protein